MKIAVVGIGAMGSVYAAMFAEAGHDVVAVDTWKEHVDAINRNGLRLSGKSGDRVVKGILATTDYSEIEGFNICILATKAGSVEEAARSISPFVSESDSTVIAIQNGMGSEKRIRAKFEKGNLLLGIAEGFGASIKEPGHAHHNAMKMIHLGEISGGVTERLKLITNAWKDAGFDACAHQDIHLKVWEKFLCNVTVSAPCAVFDKTVGELLSDKRLWEIATICTREAYDAGLLEGITFSFADPIQFVTEFARLMPDARPSLAIDHRNCKLSEIDAINGMVPEIANRHGQNAPLNQALTEIIHLRESKFSSR